LPKYLVFVEAKAQKQFRKLPKVDQDRIIEVLNTLEKEGLAARIHIKKLQGYQRHYRIRLGNYRIRFELSADQAIVVYSISPRENAYE
jgi:mRNA interferase RelE/StbE